MERKVASRDLVAQLKELFKEAKRAHLEAFADVDGADAEWPSWYAQHMHRRLCTLLQADFTRSELIYLLVMVDRERGARAPGAEWTGYYARFFLDRFGPGPQDNG